MKIFPAALLGIALFGFLPSFGLAGQPAQNEDEDFLKRAKIATDNDSLLKLLHQRADCENPEQLDRLVKKLGSSGFAEREATFRTLTQFSYFALPSLQKRFSDSNVELSRRAKECALKIESAPHLDWIGSAVKVLAARKAVGSMEAILTILPSTKEADAEAEMYYALDALIEGETAIPDSLFKALDDPEPARRAAAACIIGRRGDHLQQAKVRLVADKDPVALVRLRGAQGLLAAGQNNAIPTLIDLLRDSPVAISWQAEELLRWCANGTAPSSVLGIPSDESRRKCHQQWLGWWKQHANNLQVDPEQAEWGEPGLVLAWGTRNENGGGNNLVCLVGSDHTLRWEIPWNEGLLLKAGLLSDGRLLTVRRMGRLGQGATITIRDFSSSTSMWFPIDRMEPETWRELPNGQWEFRYSPSCRAICDAEGNIDRSQGLGGQTIPSGWYSQPIGLQDGCVLTYTVEKYQPGLGLCVSRCRKGRQIVWEAFVDCAGQAAEVFPLVRFGFLSRRNADSVEWRIRLLKNGSTLVRRNAIAKLKKMTMNDAVFAAVLQAFGDKDDFVKGEAIYLAAQSPERCEKVVPEFARLLDDEGRHCSLSLRHAFGKIDAVKAVPALLVAFNDKSPPHADRRRAKALYILGQVFLGADDKITEAVRCWMTDKNPELRKWALISIAHHPKALLLLKEVSEAVRDIDDDVAHEAITCLAAMGMAANPALPALYDAMKKPKLRRSVVGTFAFVGTDDPEVLKKLIECLWDTESPEVIAGAIGAIGRRGKLSKNVVGPLTQLLDKKWGGYDGVRIRVGAARLLGVIGPDAKIALEPLKKIALTDNLEFDRKIIIDAIGKIDAKTQLEVMKNLLEVMKNVPESVPLPPLPLFSCESVQEVKLP